MHKKIAFAAGLLMLSVPLFAIAQTASASSNTSLLAALEALVQQLEQELQQLIAAKSAPISPALLPGTSTPQITPTWCSQFSSLKRGDTDATTGGEVSQLQAFLGINPTTGYYGALTQIGYGNKCVGGNSQPTSVPGMSEYTDSDFGFSFWYPSTWSVNKIKSGSGSFSPWEITIANPSNNAQNLSILEVTDDSVADASGSYYFDAQAGVWMHQMGGQFLQPADISNNTMGGLHIFPGNGDSFVPLSASKFLTVSAWNTDSTINWNYLTNTIVATNPNVATPISTNQQIATIGAEETAYGTQSSGNTSQSSSLQTYTSSQYGFTVQYDPGSFTTASPSVMPFMGYPVVPHTLLSLNYTGGKNIAGFDAANITFGASNAVTYEDCTRMLSASNSDAVQSTTKQVTINGRTFYEDSTGDAATGHYSSTNSYRTYYNGACYETSLQIDTSRTADGAPSGDTTSVSNALQTVLDSFTFTVPDTAPALHASASPTWSTFVGQQTPTSFTYPGSFLIYESEDESDVGPGVKAGLQTFQSGISPGAIAVQMTPSKYFPAGDSATQAMQAKMNTEPIAYPSQVFTPLTLGGETAYISTAKDGTSVIYVAHGSNFFRILLWAPLLSQEYQNFVSSFRFTQ